MRNNTVHCCQTPYNIATIVEQLSNYNSLLREKIETEKEVFMKQNCKNSDENRCASKLCASATECVPQIVEDKSARNDSKVNHSA